MENAELKDSISGTVLVVKDERDLFRKCLIYIYMGRENESSYKGKDLDLAAPESTMLHLIN